MIKFPTTISEYTDGKLWRNGVDESIARRILVGLNTLEDQKELDLRKMYLAYYYCEIGEYDLSMTIAKQSLLEGKYVDDAIVLIKNICVRDKDVENFTRLIKLIDKLYNGKTPTWFFDEVEEFEDTLFFYDKDTGKGRVSYKGAMAEYYRGGKLIFSVEDKSCEALFKDSIARHLLADSQPEAAIELLSSIKLDKLKDEIRLCCHQTLVAAYCMIEEYDKAYEYCSLLMSRGIYLSEMADVFFYLYEEGSPRFEEMKGFYLRYDKFDSAQLSDVHSLAKDIEDSSFWNEVLKNNPIDCDDTGEDTLILKGILAFNARDYEGADRLFKQATAIYGRLGKSWLYRYYVEYFISKSKKGVPPRNSLEELFTARVDEMNTFIDKKLLNRLKKCQSRDDFLKSVDENMTELDNMLIGVYAKICDVADIVHKVYKMNFIPANEIIKKAIVDGDYNNFIRTICLANYMIFTHKKKFIYGKEAYDNPFASMLNYQAGGSKEPFAYGIAIYLAGLIIFQGVDNDDFKKECKFLKKIYARAQADYSQVRPLAVFALIYAYVNDEKVHYVKDVVKRKDVEEFAMTYFDEGGFFDCDEVSVDDDVFSFLAFCFEIDAK